MKSVIKVDEGFFVAPQIDVSAAEELRSHGIATIINNRPDGEEAGQPTAGDAGRLFEQEGFEYHHLPVTMNSLSPEVVEEFYKVWEGATGPVVAHCRSGMRSILLWALAEARYGAKPADVILSKASNAGVDLSSAEGLLQQIAAMPR